MCHPEFPEMKGEVVVVTCLVCHIEGWEIEEEAGPWASDVWGTGVALSNPHGAMFYLGDTSRILGHAIRVSSFRGCFEILGRAI